MSKLIVVTFLIFFVGSVFGQEDENVKEIDYCGKKFNVPDNCTARSAYELSCNDYVIQWLYMNEQMLQTMPAQFINQLKNKVKKMKKEPVQCVSMGYPLEGYKITYKNKRQPLYKIIAYGPVNGQPVMILLTMEKDPVSNEQLPEFVRQIIQLEGI